MHKRKVNHSYLFVQYYHGIKGGWRQIQTRIIMLLESFSNQTARTGIWTIGLYLGKEASGDSQ